VVFRISLELQCRCFDVAPQSLNALDEKNHKALALAGGNL
jgi:hypothetical protein